MARLPEPGKDHGTWGEILNEYLSQTLKSDGTIKDGVITAGSLAPNAVNATVIEDGTITETLLSDAVKTKLNQDLSNSKVTGPVSASDNALVRFDGVSGNIVQNSSVAVLDSGEIGIATAPVANYSLSATNPMQLVGTLPIGYETTIYGQAGQNVFKRANGSVANPTPVVTGDSLGAFSFRGYRDNSFSGSKAYIMARTTQSWTSDANGTQIIVQTTPNDSSTLRTVGEFDQSGQLRLPVQGDNAGLLIGVDTNLYRSAANTLKTDDNLIIGAPGTASGSTVTVDGVQTLTNKTFSTLTFGGATTLPQNATLASYNTTDLTTNYERVRQYWNGNIYYVHSEGAGANTARAMQLQVGSSSQNTSILLGSAGGVTVRRNGTAVAYLLNVASTGLISSTGSQTATLIDPVINQSGDAGYTGLVINPTETATGTGAKNLIDAQVGGASKFKVDNTGKVTINNGPTISTGAGSPEGTVAAPVGSLYTRTNGGAGTTLYVKESGTGNTGWAAK